MQQSIWRAGAFVLAAAFATAGCDAVLSSVELKVVREDKRFAVSGTPVLDLRTSDGSIDVRPGAPSQVLVTIERRAPTEEAAKAIEVTTAQEGDHITIHVERSHLRGFNWGARSASLIVTVPPNAEIDAQSGDGSIRIDKVAGALKSHTGDGSIKLSAVDGPIDVSTGDGSIAVSGRISRLHARAGDGSITIGAAPGSATADDWDVSAGDGSVSMALPPGFAAALDAHSGGGSVRVRELTLSNVTGAGGRHDLQGQLGAGGRALRIRAGDGSITLKPF